MRAQCGATARLLRGVMSRMHRCHNGARRIAIDLGNVFRNTHTKVDTNSTSAIRTMQPRHPAQQEPYATCAGRHMTHGSEQSGVSAFPR